MATIFTRIMTGDLPGNLVWRDDRCVAFDTIAPLRPGHVLVVPVVEVDHWLDLDPELVAHLFGVAQKIGQAQMAAFAPTRIGLIVAGLEVPHAHLHVIPIRDEADLDFARADGNVSGEQRREWVEALRAALGSAGHPEVVAG